MDASPATGAVHRPGRGRVFDDLQRFMRSEIVRLGKVVEHAGIARSQ